MEPTTAAEAMVGVGIEAEEEPRSRRNYVGTNIDCLEMQRMKKSAEPSKISHRNANHNARRMHNGRPRRGVNIGQSHTERKLRISSFT